MYQQGHHYLDHRWQGKIPRIAYDRARATFLLQMYAAQLQNVLNPIETHIKYNPSRSNLESLFEM